MLSGLFLDLWELRQLWCLPVSLLNAQHHFKSFDDELVQHQLLAHV